jgi:plastocyanin
MSRHIKLFLAVLILSSIPIPFFAHDGEHDELIIRMTPNGFEPKELTIWEGDEVLFINNDDVSRWPASDFHPTHYLYPEFDPREEIVPGSSWKFKFEKVGNWRMHDHIFPHMTGMIIVLDDPDKLTEEDKKDDEKLNLFSRIKRFFSNLWQKIFSKKSGVDPKLLEEFKSLDERDKFSWLEDRAKREDPKIAWQYVVLAYNSPDGVIGNPHDMAHLVGHLIYDKYGLHGIEICDPSFAFGCYHGLMEVALYDEKGGTYEQRLLLAEKGCEALGGEDAPPYWSCIHGIGHGVATYREHDMEKSLTDCNLMGEKVRTYCHDGVFMEFAISAPRSFYSRENPLYPCNSVDILYQHACARNQTNVMRNNFFMDTREIANNCISSESKEIISGCIDSLGFFIASLSKGSPELIINECSKISEVSGVGRCARAAAGELIFQNYQGWRTNAPQVCQMLDGEEKRLCETRLEEIIVGYDR